MTFGVAVAFLVAVVVFFVAEMVFVDAASVSVITVGVGADVVGFAVRVMVAGITIGVLVGDGGLVGCAVSVEVGVAVRG